MPTHSAKFKKKLTAEQMAQLEGYGAIRLPLEQVASLFNMSFETLNRMMQKDAALRDTYERGKSRSSTNVRKTLYDKATRQGDFQALKFWCQTQEGFKSADRLELTGADGGPIQTNSTLTKEQVLAELKKLQGDDSDCEEG